MCSNKTSPQSMTDFETFFLFIGGAIELLTNFVGIPLSVANLCLLARTSVIHPNMKCILILQSFFILLRGICRFIICLFKFILWDPISAESMNFFPLLANIYFTSICNRNCVPHVLIVERILATLFVRSYERRRGYLFTMLWCPFVLAISIYITFTWFPEKAPPLSTLIMISVQLVVGIVELAIFYKLGLHNSNIYQQMLQIEGSHNLSIRYQLSENIRIGKQLIPALWLNLGNIFGGAIILFWAHFKLPYYYPIQNVFINQNSFFGLLIELFIITCHPFLKRDLYQILHGFFNSSNNCRIGVQPAIVGTSNAYCSAGIAQTDLISGKTLIEHSNFEEHFAILKNAWENPTQK